MSVSPALDLKAYLQDTVHIPKRQIVTQAEYWETYYNDSDVTYEWNNGYLEEKSVSDLLTISMYKWFFKLLEYYLETHRVAQSVPLEMGFKLALSQKSEIRRPDLGVVLNTNPVPLKPEDKSYKGIFDLCIEAISDSSTKDIKRDTEDKKVDYAQARVKEYYILDGHDRYLEFYRLSTNGVYVRIKPVNGKIIQSTVLPGFQFWIEDLFSKPSPDEMIDNLVYQGFVLPGYQEEKQARLKAERQAQIAEKKTEAEKRARHQAEKQAQQAKQRSQQLADKLRSLGIDPED
jgi:Uma2 family endonuclease